jgi:hypothetical protein
MDAAVKFIYLFLSSEKDFGASCFILTKVRISIETIDSIAFLVFLHFRATPPSEFKSPRPDQFY